MKTYNTQQQINALWDELVIKQRGGEAVKKDIRKMQVIYNIASMGKNQKRVHVSKMFKAQDLYKMIKRLHNLQDRLLTLDNDPYWYNTAYTAAQHAKEDKLTARVTKALKEFNLKPVYYSHLMSIETADRRQVYIY